MYVDMYIQMGGGKKDYSRIAMGMEYKQFLIADDQRLRISVRMGYAPSC